jgi:hypothetical protein
MSSQKVEGFSTGGVKKRVIKFRRMNSWDQEGNE